MKENVHRKPCRLFTEAEEQKFEQLELETYDRNLRKTRLLKRLDRAIRKQDATAALKAARMVCAMEAWKWGFDEKIYLKSRPI